MNGLGSTETAYPVGQVLSSAYPVADLSQLQVTIGGVPASVLYAGMVYAGLYQVNIQVPGGIPAGELPVSLTLGGRSTQQNAVLTFEQ